jgi:NADPH-dependent curcumin reductase
MAILTNKQQRLVSRPAGEASLSNFQLTEEPVPELQPGQILIRHHYLSLDPYMRGRMDDLRSYAPPQPLGEVMIGGTVGEVVASRSEQFKVGDRVLNMGGWQQYQIVGPSQSGQVAKVDDSQLPLSAFLGAVGMPGVTAWVGLHDIIKPREGETIVVSAASGAVGSVVGQLARKRGCRVVGLAGGPEKCRLVEVEFGFDACIDYRKYADVEAMRAALKQACPEGIDGYFDNVGGMILDAVMVRMNDFGRIAMCGIMASLGNKPIPMAAPALILLRRLRVQGFIVTEHMQLWAEALAELGGLLKRGQLRYRESIAEGIEAAPQAFLGLLKGRNTGKQLVRLIA